MKKEKYKKVLLIILTIILLYFLTNKIFLFKSGIIEKLAGNIIYPILIASNIVTKPFKTAAQKWQLHKNLSEKYQQLKEKNEQLLQENIKLNSSIHFAQHSKELLDFQKKYELKDAIFTKILTTNFSSEEHYMLVDKGKSSGIKKDMVAIYKFQIIGRVTEVFRWCSKILLITDQSCKVAAYTNNTSAPGIVIGQNKTDSYQMAYTSHLHKIEPNDFIISSGQGLIFPEGFCLGKIKKHKVKGLYYKIKVEPLVDFNSLQYCLLTNQEKMNTF